jgi:hypothetical protein
MADKKQGKNKKYGNNKVWCQVYRATGKRERNKLLKMQRHLRHYPADNQCTNRLRSLTGVGQHGTG